MSNKEDIINSVLDNGDSGGKKDLSATVIDNSLNLPSNVDFKPGVGVDIGTSNIVVSRQTKEGTFVNRFHRNMLYPLEASDEASDLLDKSNYLYVRVGSKIYVVGDDALTLVNAIGKGEVVRPMKDGILNPSLKESSELLFYIVKAVVGEPIVPNEPLRFSIPANPVDKDVDNVFHKMILLNFFKSIGFDPKAVNEAMCVAYDCNPVVKGDEGETPLSGIVISAGAGMTNCLKGDTKIRLLSGEIKTIKELSELKDKSFWVYSCDKSGKIVPGLAHHARKTKVTDKITKITLDNNKTIECTEDHLIMLRNGEFKCAKDISINESLMPLYIRENLSPLKGYYAYFDLSGKKTGWRYVHRMVAEQDKAIKKGDIVHHSDFNKKNNNPDNLVIMSGEDHMRLHQKIVSKIIKRMLGKTYDEIYGKEKSREIRSKMSKKMNEIWKNNPEIFINFILAGKKTHENRIGKTLEEICGKKAAEIKNKMSKARKGKTFEEIYGEELAKKLKKEKSKLAKKQILKKKFGYESLSKEMKEKVSETSFKKGMEPWNKGIDSELYKKHLNINKISETSKKQWEDPENKKKMLKSRGLLVANELINKGIGISEDSYELQRKIMSKKRFSPISYCKWIENFKDEQDAVFFAHEKRNENKQSFNNHKVLSVETVCEICDVYDLTVDNFENFALESGVFVHNCALLFKGLELSSFSITKSGDYIDEQVSKVTGFAKSKITKRKEKELLLDKYNASDRVLSALSIYYNEYVDRITRLIGREFVSRGSEVQGETEVVVAGGTSMPQGFCKIFEDGIKESDIPFKVFRVRHSSTPFYSVAQGACIRAQADFAKINKK